MLRSALVVATLPALLVTGCGDDKHGKSSGPPVTLTGTTNDHGTKDISGSGKTAELEVEQDDFYFGPTFIKTVDGATVKVELKNEGSVAHTFTVAGGPDETLQPGAEKDVSVSVASGPLVFYCKFHRGQGMQGAFYTAAGQSGGGGSSPSETESPDKY